MLRELLYELSVPYVPLPEPEMTLKFAIKVVVVVVGDTTTALLTA
jgi:hypothetical protein